VSEGRLLQNAVEGPLPPTFITAEVVWSWRRWFTFGLTLICCALVGLIVWRLQDPASLRLIALTLCGLIALLTLFYVGGATLTDIWRLVTAVKTTRLISGKTEGDA
jgi:hypothetical protein